MASSMTRCTSTGCRLSCSLPLRMRVMSSKSSISRASSSTLRRMTSSARRACIAESPSSSSPAAPPAPAAKAHRPFPLEPLPLAGPPVRRSSSATIVTTGDNGVRNSCESWAKNWSFAMLASINSWRIDTSAVRSSTRQSTPSVLACESCKRSSSVVRKSVEPSRALIGCSTA